MKLKLTQPNTVKYLSSSFFILVGVINLFHTIFVLSEYYVRDFIILFILSLPLIINRKLLFTSFGLLASFVSILIFFIHLFNNTPNHSELSIPIYIIGSLIYLLSICSGLGMIYVGTFSNEKNTFKLI